MEYSIKILNFGLSIYFLKLNKNNWYYFDLQKDYDNYFNKGIIPINNEINNSYIKKILNGIIYDCIENSKNSITIFSKSLYKKLVHSLKYENY